MTAHDQTLIRFAEVAPPEILKVARPDSCIFSTRVTIEVLRKFGAFRLSVPAECVPSDAK